MFDLMFRTEFIEMAKDLSPFFVSLLTFVSVFVLVSIFIRDFKSFGYTLSISATLTITAYFAVIYGFGLARFDYFFDFFKLLVESARVPMQQLLTSSFVEIYRLVITTAQFKTAAYALYIQRGLLFVCWSTFKLYINILHLYVVNVFDEFKSFITSFKLREIGMSNILGKEIKTLNCVFNC